MTLLKQINTPFGTIRITREADGTLCYYQNGCFHSQATRGGVSVCAYVHVITEIIRQKKSKNVLIIGCGGGTLATMISRLGARVTVVDINPVAFDIARDYFKMPKSVECVKHNGLTFVRKTPKRFDAIVIDVFDSDNNVPEGFTKKGFLAACRKILRRGGLLILNVITPNDKDRRADYIAAQMKGAAMAPTLYDWPGEKDRNTLVVGGSVARIKIPSGQEPRWMKPDLKGVIRRAQQG